MKQKSKENSISYFQKNSINYDFNSRLNSRFIERFGIWKRLIDKYRSDTNHIADIGCGSGELTKYLVLLGKTDAIDGSESMLKITEDKINNDYKSNLNIIHSGLPFEERFVNANTAKYNLLVVSSVIEYIDDDDVLINQLYKILSINGYLIISFPNKTSLYRKFEKYIIRNIKSNSYSKHIRNYYSIREFIKKMQKFTFKESIYYSLPFQETMIHVFKNKRPIWLSNLCVCVFQKCI